ncbi:unnamed protein product [Rotaria magnacalcarata]|uniref:Uncharacterized protein n=1 Tax=Rotaria magnacalcarata TaxID=392030 RepID=A0A8S3C8N7_9BILA|nr:unnamed protein product [Rotaria magnacalcarata]
MHYVTHEIIENCRSQRTIHAHLSSDRLFEPKQNDLTVTKIYPEKSKIMPYQTSIESRSLGNADRIIEGKRKNETVQQQRYFNCVLCRCSLIHIIIAIIATVIFISACTALSVALCGIKGETATTSSDTHTVSSTSTTTSTSTTRTTSTTTSNLFFNLNF